MSEEAIRLPALPEPDVFRATWDGGVGWSQYHDEHDPLPAEWDDGPPNEVRGFFTGEALQEYARAAVLAERERCAVIADDEARIREHAGQQHPEDSPGRGHCFAGARAAANVAKGIRSGEVVAKSPARWPRA